jgi:SAM-dependent MidA family methyltransferase
VSDRRPALSPFARDLHDRIGLEGPVTVERYMDLCLRHYYATRDPFGPDGDFVTAPEISQMFGELIGLWAVAVWQSMGGPAPVRLVEIGPGRGTLMADALRAARLAPDFLEALSLHLVETSPVLRERQREVLAGAGPAISWHAGLDEIPSGAALVIANEFLDALPVRQFVATERGWCERLVGLADDALTFGLRPEPEPSLEPPRRIGDVLEVPAAAVDVTRALSGRILREGGAALFLDYGYWGPAFGDSLQAVKNHAFAHPLAEPGEADLTTHVDFHRIAEAAAAKGARIHGAETQRDFLAALGIEQRAAALSRRASPSQADQTGRALERLTASGPEGMGALFKVLCVSHPSMESLPGLRPGPVPPRP